MLVDWEAAFDSYSRAGTGEIQVWICADDYREPLVFLELPAFMFDVVREFAKGDRMNFRGIISEINSLAIHLNYVDVALSETSP
jgi:hypothetical protein